MTTQEPELGKLEWVDPRDAWKHEALDFTPWLATNLDRLAEVLGIELEFEDSEVYVGPYRADIVATDPRDDSRVLIENQLEDADLQHLGQLLAYLAGLEAKVVVWIAEGLRRAESVRHSVAERPHRRSICVLRDPRPIGADRQVSAGAGLRSAATTEQLGSAGAERGAARRAFGPRSVPPRILVPCR